MPVVLVVDDDEKLLKMLQRTLTYEGLDVCTASDGLTALEQVRSCRPDVIVLDWMMPGLDGMEVIRHLRSEGNQAGILMLTARDAVESRVQGLDRGADDYLVKPFAPAELVARLRALMRRSEGAAHEGTLSFADLRLDPVTHRAHRGDRELQLTPTEFALLRFLMLHPRQVLQRDQILTHVWGYDFGGDDNVLEVYVGYLRKKTEKTGRRRLIQTVRGVGYVLREA
jgi:two-component system response regulator MprA